MTRWYRLRRFWCGCWPVVLCVIVEELVAVVLPPQRLILFIAIFLAGVVGAFWGYLRRRKFWP